MFYGTSSYDATRPEVYIYFTDTAGSKIGGSSPQIYASKEYDEDIYKCLKTARIAAIPTTTTTTASRGVFFGTGKTPATAEDYTLESPITSGVSVTNPQGIAVKDNGEVMSLYATYALKNVTATDIEISEIGVVSHLQQNHVLMERTVLDEPVVIPAGGSKAITYRYDVHYNMG
jgi:hypothetical protein